MNVIHFLSNDSLIFFIPLSKPTRKINSVSTYIPVGTYKTAKLLYMRYVLYGVKGSCIAAK